MRKKRSVRKTRNQIIGGLPSVRRLYQYQMAPEGNWEMYFPVPVDGSDVDCRAISTRNMTTISPETDAIAVLIQVRAVINSTGVAGTVTEGVFRTYWDTDCSRLADEQTYKIIEPPGLSAGKRTSVPFHLFCPISSVQEDELVPGTDYAHFRISLEQISGRVYHNHFAIIRYYTDYKVT